MKTKKYNYPNMLFCNKFTYDKLELFAKDIRLLKIHWELRSLKDFKIVIREELEDNKVYFYVNHFNSGEIKVYNLNEILK